MRWHEITIRTTEVAVEAVSDLLHQLGAGGVSIEESGTLNKPRDTSLGQWYELPLNDIPEGEAVIIGYYAEISDIESLFAEIKQAVERLPEFGLDIGTTTFEHKEVDEEDWANAWKTYYKPVQITDRLTIKPTWETYTAGDDELVIELDPGMAFGTGTHPTTTLCLRALEHTITGGEDVIDVGTGSGILAIAAAKLDANHVLALDLDPVAVSSATENVRLNGIEQRVTVMESDLLQALNRPNGTPSSAPSQLGITPPVQIVVANILADIIIQVIPDVRAALASGGTFIASGIIQSKAAEVERALTDAGFTITHQLEDQDWVVITAQYN